MLHPLVLSTLVGAAHAIESVPFPFDGSSISGLAAEEFGTKQITPRNGEVSITGNNRIE